MDKSEHPASSVGVGSQGSVSMSFRGYTLCAVSQHIEALRPRPSASPQAAESPVSDADRLVWTPGLSVCMWGAESVPLTFNVLHFMAYKS